MDINRTEDIADQSDDDFEPEYKIYKAIKKGKECWRTHIYDEYAKDHRRLIQKNSKEELLDYLRQIAFHEISAAATLIKKAGGTDEQIKNIFDQSNLTEKSELTARALGGL